MNRFGLSDEERQELADAVGQLVSFFVSGLKEARQERDAARHERDVAVQKAERLEALIERYRHDGPRVTDQALAPVLRTPSQEDGAGLTAAQAGAR